LGISPLPLIIAINQSTVIIEKREMI